MGDGDNAALGEAAALCERRAEEEGMELALGEPLGEPLTLGERAAEGECRVDAEAPVSGESVKASEGEGTADVLLEGETTEEREGRGVREELEDTLEDTLGDGEECGEADGAVVPLLFKEAVKRPEIEAPFKEALELGVELVEGQAEMLAERVGAAVREPNALTEEEGLMDGEKEALLVLEGDAGALKVRAVEALVRGEGLEENETVAHGEGMDERLRRPLSVVTSDAVAKAVAASVALCVGVLLPVLLGHGEAVKTPEAEAPCKEALELGVEMVEGHAEMLAERVGAAVREPNALTEEEGLMDGEKEALLVLEGDAGALKVRAVEALVRGEGLEENETVAHGEGMDERLRRPLSVVTSDAVAKAVAASVALCVGVLLPVLLGHGESVEALVPVRAVLGLGLRLGLRLPDGEDEKVASAEEAAGLKEPEAEMDRLAELVKVLVSVADEHSVTVTVVLALGDGEKLAVGVSDTIEEEDVV